MVIEKMFLVSTAHWLGLASSRRCLLLRSDAQNRCFRRRDDATSNQLHSLDGCALLTC